MRNFLPFLLLAGVSCAYLPSTSGEYVNTPYISRTTGTGVVEQGGFELEGLVESDPGERVKSILKANLGLGPGFELGLSIEPYHSNGSPAGRGVGDVNIVAKYQFADGSKGDLRGILETEVRLPTSDVGSAGAKGESDFFLISSLGQSFGKYSLVGTYELGLLGEAGRDSLLVEHAAVLAATMRLHSNLRGFIEASMVHEPRDSITAWYGGGGAGYKVTDDIELQAALQLGLNDTADDYLFVFGFTYEMGRFLPVLR
ncbi:MAG: hypothetical protein COA70_10060 [Planctomycetota bacterium]|nr:MAG: hypothetical protein COA70_10060 [Planctomycetota bacterium]